MRLKRRATPTSCSASRALDRQARRRIHNTSLIIAKDGKTLLVDLGRNIPDSLHAKGINTFDFDAYHITHSHADHIGGLEELLLMSRYVAKKKPEMIITERYQQELWEFSLKGGCEYNEGELLRFSDLVTPVRPNWIQERPREMYRYVWNGVEFVIFRTIHVPGDVASGSGPTGARACSSTSGSSSRRTRASTPRSSRPGWADEHAAAGRLPRLPACRAWNGARHLL
jgi:hypothetical protein